MNEEYNPDYDKFKHNYHFGHTLAHRYMNE